MRTETDKNTVRKQKTIIEVEIPFLNVLRKQKTKTKNRVFNVVDVPIENEESKPKNNSQSYNSRFYSIWNQNYTNIFYFLSVIK